MVETLETRDLPSSGLSASVAGGVLSIQDSQAGDQIHIRRLSDQISVDGVAIQVGDASQSSVSASSVSRIDLHTPAGNDQVWLGDVRQPLALPVSLPNGAAGDMVFTPMSPGGLTLADDVSQAAIRADGMVFALHANGSLDRSTSSGWRTLDTDVQSFALLPDGQACVLENNGNLLVYAADADPQHYSLLDSPGAVQSFTLAGDGSIWFLGTAAVDGAGDHAIYRLSGGQVTQMPGAAVGLGAAEGAAWALNANDQVSRWDGGGNWVQQASLDAGDGSVWFLGTASVDPAGESATYCFVNGQLSQIGGAALQLTTVNGLPAALSAGGATTILGLGRPAAGATWSVAPGTLFGAGGPSYLDVRQGVEGDCWLLASLAEVAARAPADITSMFTYDGTVTENGTPVGLYTVRLYNGSQAAEYVTVDTELPSGGGLYDQPVDGVLWVALAEKAYAVANEAGFVPSSHPNTNSYDALNGGWPGWALAAITGHAAANGAYGFNPRDAAGAWNAGQLVVLSTSSPASSNILGDHAYALVGYDPSSATPYLLFNPWGTDGAGWVPGYRNMISGRFTANASFLSANFSEECFGAGAAPAVRSDGPGA
jgi:hypothetical protein